MNAQVTAGYYCIHGGQIHETVQLAPGLLVDIADDGNVVGVETVGGPVDLPALVQVLRLLPERLVALGREQASAARAVCGSPPMNVASPDNRNWSRVAAEIDPGLHVARCTVAKTYDCPECVRILEELRLAADARDKRAGDRPA